MFVNNHCLDIASSTSFSSRLVKDNASDIALRPSSVIKPGVTDET